MGFDYVCEIITNGDKESMKQPYKHNMTMYEGGEMWVRGFISC